MKQQHASCVPGTVLAILYGLPQIIFKTTHDVAIIVPILQIT